MEQNGSEREPEGKQRPAIRTMRSDVSEFLKTSKPSLVSLLARQAEASQPQSARHGETLPLKFIALGIGALLVIIGGAIIFLKFSAAPPVPAAPEAAAPPPDIFYEETDEITVVPARRDLLDALKKAGRAARPAGSFTRLVVRIKTRDSSPLLDLREFLNLLGAKAPPDFTDGVSGPPQFFIHQGNSGYRLGVIVEAKNPARAMQGLLSWEPSMERDLEALFSVPPPADLKPFRDLTYRNIDFRYHNPEAGQDGGIGYLYFPAKRRIIIATSEESLRLVIQRLFAAP